MGAMAPFMPILGPVVNQQQDAGVGNRIGQQVEHGLRLRVDPMEILENDDERLLEALADENALEPLLGAPPPNLRIHAGHGVVAVLESEQCKEIGDYVFQRTVELQQLAD